MTGIVDELLAAGVKVVLLTPGCCDPDFDRYSRLKGTDWNYNQTLQRLAQEVVDLGAQKKVPVFNLYDLMLDVQTRAKIDAPGGPGKPRFTMIPDGIHPTALGHAIMSYALLKTMRCTALPSGLEIDAASGKITTDRCKVTDLKHNERRLSFTRTDDALPAPFYTDIAPIPKYLTALDELNVYRFKVVGLAAPVGTAWELEVDGIKVGRFSAAELAGGVDLSQRPGPWRGLAQRVDQAVGRSEAEFFQRWLYLSHFPAPIELQGDLDRCITQADAFVDVLQARRSHLPDSRTWKWALTAMEAKP
jgi:hypothetical protein